MPQPFFAEPIRNAPYRYPDRHREVDRDGQTANNMLPRRRRQHTGCFAPGVTIPDALLTVTPDTALPGEQAHDEARYDAFDLRAKRRQPLNPDRLPTEQVRCARTDRPL